MKLYPWKLVPTVHVYVFTAPEGEHVPVTLLAKSDPEGLGTEAPIKYILTWTVEVAMHVHTTDTLLCMYARLFKTGAETEMLGARSHMVANE